MPAIDGRRAWATRGHARDRWPNAPQEQCRNRGKSSGRGTMTALRHDACKFPRPAWQKFHKIAANDLILKSNAFRCAAPLTEQNPAKPVVKLNAS
jgi:hypothetical protein